MVRIPETARWIRATPLRTADSGQQVPWTWGAPLENFGGIHVVFDRFGGQNDKVKSSVLLLC